MTDPYRDKARGIAWLTTGVAREEAIATALQEVEDNALERASKIVDAPVDYGGDRKMQPEISLLEEDREALSISIRALKSTPPAPADDWLPIETAPRDGTWVLLARDANQHTAFWRGDIWHCGGHQYFNNPTHWQPLPTPPRAGE